MTRRLFGWRMRILSMKHDRWSGNSVRLIRTDGTEF
jgi:hypothetical protein